MRICLSLLFVLLTAGSSQASLIQINYTGTYSGTTITGDPAISHFTTIVTDPTPFSLTFTFDTTTQFAYYSDSPSNSILTSSLFGPSVGRVSSASFFAFFPTGAYHADDTATSGQTSQSLVDQTISKGISYTPSLYIGVNHPDIPGSITESFSILSGLTGRGSYSYSYTGNFTYFSQSFVLIPETITVSVSSVPEPATWAMLLIGFAGIGFAGYRRHSRKMLTV